MRRISLKNYFIQSDDVSKEHVLIYKTYNTHLITTIL